MQLTTPVAIPVDLPRLSQQDELLLMGSCFATNIGERLVTAKFRCNVNPFGVLYNPASVATALRQIVTGKAYTEEDLFFFGEQWHSPMHHSDFSSDDQAEALRRINGRLHEAHRRMDALDGLLITFGTAYVYERKEVGAEENGKKEVGKNETVRIVGNCHKQSEKLFNRRRLEVDEIVADYASLLSGLTARNLKLKVIFTVSPIRHIRDGLHANQLSKSILLLAIDRLQALFPEQVFYFPAYELLLDELRDYRFYADDMVHPSTQAIRYVWEKFAEACFTDETKEIARECEAIAKALAHTPVQPQSAAYRHFLQQTAMRIERLKAKYPYLDF
ncbi:MAG: GSCFA domain-containing protein [Prevotellaceae bacterium]|jgi:hypothetical protein|nr:GSCFA domain-containing protein [Prevotellaceae bacterium]